MREIEIEVEVNGEPRRATVEARLTLADFIRERCGLTGTHLGCEHGVCGACTVLVDGVSVRSCLMFAIQAQGTRVQTVEGLAGKSGRLHPLQEAFHRHHGLQCGYCTPGLLMTALELLSENPNPSESDVRIAISGNICRCTGYQSVIASVLAAAAQLQEHMGAKPWER